MPAARNPRAPSSTTTASQPGPSRPSRSRQDSTASAHLADLSMTDPTDAVSPTSDAAWTEPPWVGFLETTEDALLILEAARRRLIPRVTRRLADRERKLIQSGSVFVFEEEESGIKRWTDGFLWSPSRILGNFLLYRETDKRNPDGTPATRPGRSNTTSSAPGASSLLVAEEPSPVANLSRPRPDDLSAGGYSAAGTSGLDRARERILLGSLTNSQKFKEDGMMKKTFSLTLPNSSKTHHIVSYYKVSDVEAGRLRTPSSLPEFAALEISPEFLDKTHFRVQPRVEVGEDGRVRFRGETAEEPESPAPEPPAELPASSPVHLQSHSQHAGHVHTHTAHPQPYHHRPSYATSHSSSNIGHTAYPSSSSTYSGGHSRNSSIGTTVSNDYAALAAAAKAQAETSARMYLKGVATANAAAATSSSSATPRTHSAQTNGSYYPTPSQPTSGATSSSIRTGVGSTLSSLGLHYPSALNTATYSASSSMSPPSTTKTVYSPTEFSNSYSPTAYLTDNSTGAPAFQAPQLYNPANPSASANSTHATATSYPQSLAPGRRSSTFSSATPSVRSGSVSVSTGRDDSVSVVSGGHTNREGRSGSRGSESSSGHTSSTTPGSLSSSVMTSTIASEAHTPSLTSTSSRRSSTGLTTSRPDPYALEKMIASKAGGQLQANDAYADLPLDMSAMNMFSYNMSIGVDDLNLGVDSMIMSPTEGADLAPGSAAADEPLPTASINGTWCGANTYGDMTYGNGASYVDSPITQSPSHTHAGSWTGYNIPPPPTRQKSMPYPTSSSNSMYPAYQMSGAYDASTPVTSPISESAGAYTQMHYQRLQ